jgi:hypothetical protein
MFHMHHHFSVFILGEAPRLEEDGIRDLDLPHIMEQACHLQVCQLIICKAYLPADEDGPLGNPGRMPVG